MEPRYEDAYQVVVNAAGMNAIVAICFATGCLVFFRFATKKSLEDSYSSEDWKFAAWIVSAIVAVIVLINLAYMTDGLVNTRLRATQTIWEMKNPKVRVVND